MAMSMIYLKHIYNCYWGPESSYVVTQQNKEKKVWAYRRCVFLYVHRVNLAEKAYLAQKEIL